MTKNFKFRKNGKTALQAAWLEHSIRWRELEFVDYRPFGRTHDHELTIEAHVVSPDCTPRKALGNSESLTVVPNTEKSE